MWQQQQQGQFMFPSFSPFVPNHVNVYGNETNNIASNGNHMFAQNSNPSSGQYQWQSSYSTGGGENNKMSYERNPNQEQYASYPSDAIYRRASGPGWQRQEVFYPANPFK
jgi:hypothetical protein